MVAAPDELPFVGARLAAEALSTGDRVLVVHRGALDSAQLGVALEEAGVDVRLRSGSVELVHAAGGPAALADAAARTRQYAGGGLRLIMIAATGPDGSCAPEIAEDDVVAVTCLIDSSRIGGSGLHTVFAHDAVDVRGQLTDLHPAPGRALALDLLLGLLRRVEDVDRAADQAVTIGLEVGTVARIAGAHRRRIEDRRTLVALRGEVAGLRSAASQDLDRARELTDAEATLRAADGDVGALLATASRAIGSAVLLEDPDFRLLRWSDEPGRPPPDLAQLLSATRRARLVGELLPGVPTPVRLGTPRVGTRLVMRLGEQLILGYLSVPEPVRPDRAANWLSRLEAPMVAVLRGEHDLGRVVGDLRSSLVSRLVAGTLDAAETLQTAAHLGWRSGAHRRLAAVLWREDDRSGRSETLRDGAQRAGFSAGISAGMLAVVLDADPAATTRLLDWLHPEWSVAVGTGAVVSDPSDAARSFREAVWGARLALTGQRTVVAFDELGIHRLLLPGAEGGDPEFEAPISALEDDAATGFDALGTLGVYLDCGGSPRATAQQLGLHVNSLRYRLERITAVCGVDLGDPEQRFRLQLALRLRHARKALNER